MDIKASSSKLYLFASLFVTSGQPANAQCETWQTFDSNGQTGVAGNVNCIQQWNSNLVLGGNFFSAGFQQRNYIVLWDGTDWQSLTANGEIGVNAPFGTQVFALTVWNGHLIAGGTFTTAGGQTVNRIAR